MLRFPLQYFQLRNGTPVIKKSFRRTYAHSVGFNSLSANPTKWSNTLKQFVGNLPTNCLSVFDHFVILALKGLK